DGRVGLREPLRERRHGVAAAQLRFVEDVDRPLAGLAAGAHGQPLTRPRYRPSRVSTLTRSPVVTNSGTWISAPVSSVAGFVPPVDRSPCRPGSVWLIVSSTLAGSSTYSGVPSLNAITAVCSSSR